MDGCYRNFRASLTLRGVMFPWPSANPLNQLDLNGPELAIIAGRKAWGCFYVGPRLGLSSFSGFLR